MDEDALSPEDAYEAGLIWCVRRLPVGYAIELAGPDDHVMDRQTALTVVRMSLERGELVSLVVPQ